jgi:hypothetical protein
MRRVCSAEKSNSCFYGVLAHCVLQTSCWEVQLSGHDAVLVMPLPDMFPAICPRFGAICPNAAGGTASGPVVRQLFWQLMAALSQPLAHNVAFSPEINGVTASGVGVV